MTIGPRNFPAPEVGDQVAEYAVIGGPGGQVAIEIARVARITATLVILDNGARYNRDTLHTGGEIPSMLYPADCELVRQAEARARGERRLLVVTEHTVFVAEDSAEGADLPANLYCDHGHEWLDLTEAQIDKPGYVYECPVCASTRVQWIGC